MITMLLAIDVGNTNTVIGVFREEKLLESWRLPTRHDATPDELVVTIRSLFDHKGYRIADVTAIVIASVVPPVTPVVVEMVERMFKRRPLMIEHGIKTGMPVLYENPSEVGADRIVNGVAAYHKYGAPFGRAVIVVDFGTATTFDCISRKGEYLGGVICPGIQISAEALFRHAARLPRIEVRKPEQVIGRTTVASMQSGLFFGYADLVRGLLARIQAEIGSPAHVIATGGLATVIAGETPGIQAVEPDLTLVGLRLIWERNQ